MAKEQYRMRTSLGKVIISFDTNDFEENKLLNPTKENYISYLEDKLRTLLSYSTHVDASTGKVYKDFYALNQLNLIIISKLLILSFF